MNKRIVLHGVLGAFAAVALASAPTASAQLDAKAAAGLAEKHTCTVCHQPEQKVLGPTFKELVAKYKSDQSVLPKLAEKVRKGGGGAWGDVPMPANAAISDAEIMVVLQWMLSH